LGRFLPRGQVLRRAVRIDEVAQEQVHLHGIARVRRVPCALQRHHPAAG